MAIVFLNGLQENYPAYNDSYIRFHSDEAAGVKAEVTCYPSVLFPRKFIIYANTEGVYTFNVKEVVKARFKNLSSLVDSAGVSVGVFDVLDERRIIQTLDFEILGNSTQEIQSLTFSFFRSVVQYDEVFQSIGEQLLNYENSLRYVEGFPFFLEMKRFNYVVGTIVTLYNSSTNLLETINPSESGILRIDLNQANSIFQNGFNKMGLYIFNASDFSQNATLLFNIFKEDSGRGVYLKWYNGRGGYEHHLFHEFYKKSSKVKNMGFVNDSEFNNIDSLNSNTLSTGKSSKGTINVKYRFVKDEYEKMKSLEIAPVVEMYTSLDSLIAGKFVRVEISTVLNYISKRHKNEITLRISEPTINTIKY